MQKKKISVIIPVYNAEKYLRKCVDSVLSQTYRNLEIILVDDGSQDDSFKICQSYVQVDSRVVAYTKTNGGQASARNYALERVHGDYISFVDNDDWCDERLYEHLMNLVDKYNADIVGAKEYSNDVGKYSDKHKVFSMKEYATKLLPDEIGSHVLAQLFKRELFDNTFFPFSRSVEDMRLFTLIIEKVNIIVKSEAELYHYSIHENNTSFLQARTPSSSLDRAEAFCERYAIVSRLIPEKLPIIVKKTVTFGLGGIGMTNSKNYIEYREQISTLVKFFKDHKEEIKKNEMLEWGRKLAVEFAIRDFYLPLRIVRKLRKLVAFMNKK